MFHRNHLAHHPSETHLNTATVECARSGPEYRDYKNDTQRRYTLADVAAWVDDLRRLGAPEDLPLPMEADGLVVTLDGPK